MVTPSNEVYVDQDGPLSAAVAMRLYYNDAMVVAMRNNDTAAYNAALASYREAAKIGKSYGGYR